MKQLLFSLIIILFYVYASASNFFGEDSTNVKTCKWRILKINGKLFGKSSDSTFRYNKAHFDIGVGRYNNPASNRLQQVFIINGYSGLSDYNGMLGDVRSATGTPVVYGQKNIQFHIGFGYSINKSLTLGLDFRSIPSTYIDGYVFKEPYDYANPDLVQESVNATSTQYKVNVLLLTIEQNHKKIIDISAGAAMVHYTFNVQTQLNINQYDTSSNLQIVGQGNINTACKVWGEAFNLNADIYFSKNFSLQLSEDYFINVLASIPTVEFTDGPFTRTVRAHTLNYLHPTFSGGLAFHFW